MLPETRIKRQVKLGDGDKSGEKVANEEKTSFVQDRLEQPRQEKNL
jgi:hypothetical protein